MIEDLSAFFSTADLAVAATYGTATVNGHFDNAYAETLDFAGRAPQFVFATADAPALARGNTLVITGTSYTVANVELDGTGVTLARLQAPT
jgi:hypothetical protein